MQFLRTSLAVVLATAVLPATVQGFFNCTKEDGGQIPDDIRADYDKIKEPVRGIILTILPKKDPLVEEKVYKMPCKWSSYSSFMLCNRITGVHKTNL